MWVSIKNKKALGYIAYNDSGVNTEKKVHIDCKKGAQICILANKIATQWWPNIITKESKQTIHYIYFLFSCYYVHIMFADLIKNMELQLMVVSVLLKIKFWARPN